MNNSQTTSTKDIWINWKNDSSRPKLKLNDRLFYWLFDALFEKNKGMTSTKVSKQEAEMIFNGLKEGKAEFIKEN
jgi:hypothetical protein